MTIEERKELENIERFNKLIDRIVTIILLSIAVVAVPYAFYLIFQGIFIRSFLIVWVCCAATSAWIYR